MYDTKNSKFMNKDFFFWVGFQAQFGILCRKCCALGQSYPKYSVVFVPRPSKRVTSDFGPLDIHKHSQYITINASSKLQFSSTIKNINFYFLQICSRVKCIPQKCVFENGDQITMTLTMYCSLRSTLWFNLQISLIFVIYILLGCFYVAL